MGESTDNFGLSDFVVDKIVPNTILLRLMVEILIGIDTGLSVCCDKVKIGRITRLKQQLASRSSRCCKMSK